jgi:hypothetical protein
VAAAHTEAIDGGRRMLSPITVFSPVRVIADRVRRNTKVKWNCRNLPKTPADLKKSHYDHYRLNLPGLPT